MDDNYVLSWKYFWEGLEWSSKRRLSLTLRGVLCMKKHISNFSFRASGGYWSSQSILNHHDPILERRVWFSLKILNDCVYRMGFFLIFAIFFQVESRAGNYLHGVTNSSTLYASGKQKSLVVTSVTYQPAIYLGNRRRVRPDDKSKMAAK